MIEQSKFKKLHAFKAWLMGAITLGKFATMTLLQPSGTNLTLNRRGMSRLFNEMNGNILLPTAAYTLTEEDNGKIIGFNSATGFTVTLPPAGLFTPSTGYKFTFVVAIAPTSGNHVIASVSGDDINGRIVDMAGTGDTVSANDVVNFIANQAAIGDTVEVIGTGLGWQVTGFAAVAAGITATG